MPSAVFDLARECDAAEEALRAAGAPARHARTVHKENALRILILAFAPGGVMAEHVAQGPITVQGIRGVVRFRIGETEHVLHPGSLLTLQAKVPHALVSDEGGCVMVTIALPTS